MENRQIDYAEKSVDTFNLPEEEKVQVQEAQLLNSTQKEGAELMGASSVRNIFKIRHGNTAPTAIQLEPYELGFDTSKGELYIGQSNADPIKVGKNYATADSLSSYALKTSLDNYLPLVGGSITGELKLENKIFLKSLSYGYDTPTVPEKDKEAEEGRIFFKILK